MNADLIPVKDVEIISDPYFLPDFLETEANLRVNYMYFSQWHRVLSKRLSSDSDPVSERDLRLVELLRKLEAFKQKYLRFYPLTTLIREISGLTQRLQVLQEQRDAIHQGLIVSTQSMNALAIAVLSEPVNVPLHEKTLLSVKEAAAHTGVGQNRLRRIGKSKIGELALWDGNKLMFNREKLDRYLSKSYSI